MGKYITLFFWWSMKQYFGFVFFIVGFIDVEIAGCLE